MDFFHDCSFFLILLGSQHAQLFWAPFAGWRPSGKGLAVSDLWAVAALLAAVLLQCTPQPGRIGHPAAAHPGSLRSPRPTTSTLRRSRLLLTHGFPAGLMQSTERQTELLQCRLLILKMILCYWLVRWFLLCFICRLSSLACMLKLALHFHLSPSLILMQAAM